jgi:hypothetical protein
LDKWAPTELTRLANQRLLEAGRLLGEMRDLMAPHAWTHPDWASAVDRAEAWLEGRQ